MNPTSMFADALSTRFCSSVIIHAFANDRLDGLTFELLSLCSVCQSLSGRACALCWEAVLTYWPWTGKPKGMQGGFFSYLITKHDISSSRCATWTWELVRGFKRISGGQTDLHQIFCQANSFTVYCLLVGRCGVTNGWTCVFVGGKQPVLGVLQFLSPKVRMR